MSETNKKLSVSGLFWEQIALNFVVVAVLIALGALLTFRVMGEEYTEWTIVGFFATVFFAFIVFLPAGTLYAARAEFAKGGVEVRQDEKTGAIAPIANPLLKTAPLAVAFAAASTAIVYALVYWGGWTPSPLVTTLASFLFVVPYAIIVRLNIFRDIEGLAAQGAFRAKAAPSKTRHIWMTYIIPNVVFQAIINLPLGYRGFSHAAAAIADRAGPGVVPVVALAPDFAITFMFVCSFTFLAVMAHTASDMFEGEMTYSGRARGINGFLLIIVILLMGLGLGILFALIPPVTGVATVSFGLAMVLKFLVVVLSVYVAARLGVGWMGKKFNDAVAHKTATAQ
ncbi:hypothetical protein [Roseiarcus sp.]|uniref:hypothetical protein n=1 Tax=Roseiarcus sp. TaxID=1969460 RepID=UPI003F9B758A